MRRIAALISALMLCVSAVCTAASATDDIGEAAASEFEIVDLIRMPSEENYEGKMPLIEPEEDSPAEFPVALPEGFTGAPTVGFGQVYTFTANTPENVGSLCASMGGVPVEVRRNNETREYYVENVTGELVITVAPIEENLPFNIVLDTSGAACRTLSFPEDRPAYDQREPYIITVRHEELRRDRAAGSEYIYSMPLLKMKDSFGDWHDFFGYYLETVTDDAAYTKLWKLCIPGRNITGDIMISADRSVRSTASVRNIAFENIEGVSALSDEAFDASDVNARDYCFSVKNAPAGVIVYSVGGGEERKAEAVGEYIYRIPKKDITADIVVAVREPDRDGYNEANKSVNYGFSDFESGNNGVSTGTAIDPVTVVIISVATLTAIGAGILVFRNFKGKKDR